MPLEALRAWHRLPLGNIKLLNAYGPTEATITATCYDVPCDQTPDFRVPIGTPVGGRSVYVLDADRQAVPIGVAGELYIGGTGLARGYLNRPELTSEKFVSNPFDDDPAARLYRTGDRCRWRADGNLEFLGRLDDQVKLRGYRIELGEIQAVLNEHPDVGQSVVMLREDATASSGRAGEKRLVGYCVPRADVELDFVELARYLRTKLPGYMIPAAWVSLESLPLTSGGKLDRQALPTPDADRSAAAGEYLAPRTQIEELLVVAWREVLGIGQIGVHDNYFELGGHSLSAMRVIARVEQRFGVTIPVSLLFERPTIAELATAIETIQERQPAMPPDIDELLATVEAMTEAEAQQLVAKDTVKS
jgi:acyl carrier protein